MENVTERFMYRKVYNKLKGEVIQTNPSMGKSSPFTSFITVY